MNAPAEPAFDIREKGAPLNGEPQRLDRRLFMQLLAFGGCTDSAALAKALDASGMAGVLYEDVNDASGVALLSFNEDPEFFVTRLRAFLMQEPFRGLSPKPEYTMLGRTYAGGY